MRHSISPGCVKIEVEEVTVKMYRVKATDIITNSTSFGEMNADKEVATKSAISRLESDVAFRMITNNSLNKK